MLQLYVRLRRCDGADGLQGTGDAIVNLLNWIRMLDRHNPSRIPLNSYSRLHFAGRGQGRWFHWNVQFFRAVSLDVQRQLFSWMCGDVFQQRERIRDGGLLKPAGDISGREY